MEKLKPCPFCGGKAKISYKNYKFYGRNGMGDKKQKYRLQVICNRCRSRGKPIVTDWLINPNPYAMFRKEQSDMFAPYIAKATEAWNKRAVPEEIDVPIYDKETRHENCTVQILENTETGRISVGWWRNETNT